jgi:predicted DNA-binding protein
MQSKKIASFSLSEEAIEILEKTAKALGKNRSEFLEWVITEGFKFTPEIKEKIEAISKLQAKIEGVAR